MKRQSATLKAWHGKVESGSTNGALERNRTSDTRFRKPLLYPLSYKRTLNYIITKSQVNKANHSKNHTLSRFRKTLFCKAAVCLYPAPD